MINTSTRHTHPTCLRHFLTFLGSILRPIGPSSVAFCCHILCDTCYPPPLLERCAVHLNVASTHYPPDSATHLCGLCRFLCLCMLLFPHVFTALCPPLICTQFPVIPWGFERQGSLYAYLPLPLTYCVCYASQHILVPGLFFGCLFCARVRG